MAFSKLEQYLSRKHRNSLQKSKGGFIDDLSSSCSGSPKSTVSDRQFTTEEDRATEEVFEMAKDSEIEMEDLGSKKKKGSKIFEFLIFLP